MNCSFNLPGMTDCKRISLTQRNVERTELKRERKKVGGQEKNGLFPLHVCPVYVERPLKT